MSLLSEIEAGARHSRQQRSAADSATRAREELDAQRTRPVLQRMEGYLRRVADALNDSDEVVNVNYAVPKLGDLKDLTQADYRVSIDPEREDALRFRFVCTGTRQVKSILSSEALARAQEMALVKSGLNCRRIAQSGERRALLVEPHVPVSLEFQRSGAGLKLRTRNLLAIETLNYTLAPERVGDEFMEALLEVVMRRGNRLPQLTGNTVPDADRQLLRKELARQERHRDAEMSGVFSRAVFPVIEAFRRLLLRQ